VIGDWIQAEDTFFPPKPNLPAKTNMSSDIEQFISYYIEGVTNLTVCCIGLIINAAAIVMLLRQKNSGSIFLKLMISLATYDLIYVLLSSICFSLPRLSIEFKSKWRATDMYVHMHFVRGSDNFLILKTNVYI
jgi:hypothetical protein